MEHNSSNQNIRAKVRDRQKSDDAAAGAVAEDMPWPTDPSCYELQDVIGEGATATVNAAICMPRNREPCAVKRINLEKVSVSLDELIKEIQAMSLCSHENVVNYYTSFVTNEELWLVMKLLGGGSLLDIIKFRLQNEDCSRGVFDEATISTVLRETLRGVEYFHNNGQLHRDIKAGNILLGSDGSIQIADFGVAAFLQNDTADRNNCRYTFVGTPCFMAPEVMEQVHGYNFKADIWSFGITAIELATGKAPYHKFPPMKVLMLTLQNEPPSLETNAEHKDQYKHFSKTFRRMLADCLQKDPSRRPTATELLKHPFFRKARDKRFLKETLIDTGPGMTVKPGDASAEGGHTGASRKSHGSGRFYRTESGEWKFSSDEEDDYREYNAARAAAGGIVGQMPDSNIEGPGTILPKTNGAATTTTSSTSNEPSSSSANVSNAMNAVLNLPGDNTICGPRTQRRSPNAAGVVAVAASGGTQNRQVNQIALNSTSVSSNNNNADEQQPVTEETDEPKETLNYVLRVRNAARELNDIRFEYVSKQDTPAGIASELVSAGLIDGQDRVVMAANLSKMIDSYGSSGEHPNTNSSSALKSIIFSLPSGVLPGEVPDEAALIGFAQLTLL